MHTRSLSQAIFALLVSVTLISGCVSSRSAQSYSSGGLNSTLDIVNHTNAPIYYLYLSSCSSNSWGTDQLGSDVISVGTSYSFAMTVGCWDLRAKLSDGREVERRGVNMRPGERNSWTLS